MADESAPKKIRDIPSYRKLQDNLSAAAALQEFWPVLEAAGLLGKCPVEPSQIAELSAQTEELVGLPDRFNSAFAARGWVAYESMSTDLMKRAVEVGDRDGVEAGEAEILSYYRDESRLRFHLRRMLAVRAWRPREELASLALEDHLAGRYHASTPVVLALIDGLVDDVGGRGLSADGSELLAWDSVAGHGTGLGVLCDIFQKGRRKTTTGPIDLPYRNGILHGRDLGYGNELVSTKSWAALFAIREWALRVQEGTAGAPDQSKAPSTSADLQDLDGVVATFQQVRAEQAELDAWRPRHWTEKPDLLEGTPEKAAADLLELWRAANYGGMASWLSALSGDERVDKRAGRLRRNLPGKRLQSFRVIGVRDEAAAVSTVFASVTLAPAGSSTQLDQFFGLRMIYEGNDVGPLVRGRPEGSWRVLERTLVLPIASAQLEKETMLPL